MLGQSNSGSEPFRPQDPLKLELKVVKTTYCAGDEDGGILQIWTRLRYKNSGREVIILYKGSNLIEEIMVSRSAEDLAAKHYESKMLPTNISAASNEVRSVPQPGTAFTILSPGKEFDNEVMVPIPFATHASTGVRVGPGTHVLQLMVSTWPASETVARELHERWRNEGNLWFREIRSRPLVFKISTAPHVEPCE